MEVSELLNTEESNMKISEYEIVVKSVHNDQRRVIMALGAPRKCSQLKNQLYRIAMKKYSFLPNLQLANQTNFGNTNIGLLIGADNFWDFVTNEIHYRKYHTKYLKRQIEKYFLTVLLTSKLLKDFVNQFYDHRQ